MVFGEMERGKGKMRLIDADSLKIHVAAAVLDGNQEHKDRASALLVAINSMPTAYDVDKVVERLEEALLNLTFHKDDNSKAWNRAIHKAIEIVKSGALNEIGKHMGGG